MAAVKSLRKPPHHVKPLDYPKKPYARCVRSIVGSSPPYEHMYDDDDDDTEAPPTTVMGPPALPRSFKQQYNKKKEEQLKELQQQELLTELRANGYDHFVKTGWKQCEEWVGKVLVMDQANCVWTWMNDGSEFGCRAFVGLWQDGDMVPLEECDNDLFKDCT